MRKTRNDKHDQLGQTLTLAVVLLSLCSTLALGLFQVSLTVREKIRLQISADMAVLSALNSQANGLNSIALANRAVLANDALAAQLNALASEVTFYRRLADKFKRILRFVPYAGAAGLFISKGAQTLEHTVRRIVSITLPLAHYSNAALRGGQKSIRYLLPFYSLKAARSTLEENMPGARLALASETMILRQARSLQKRLSSLEPLTTQDLKRKTLDRHTLKRNWRIKIAGLSPVRKAGGTLLSSDDLVAYDRLRLKTFRQLQWKWKTVLNVKSRASDFGYKTPEDLMSLETRDLQNILSLPILVQWEMPPTVAGGFFQGKKLRALSAARLLYRRDSRPREEENVFNPFWKTELIPVNSEPNVKGIVPDMLLKEVIH